MRAFLITLVVLLAAAVGADLVAERVATGKAEDRLAAHGVTDPQVDVGGFPFLTQLLSRSFGDVTMSGSAVEVDKARARQVKVHATDVKVPPSGDAIAGSVRATVVVTYAEVVHRAGLAPMTLSPVSSGKVRIKAKVSLLGNPLDVSTVAAFSAKGNAIQVTPGDLTLGDGEVAGGRLGAQLADRYTLSYRLGKLPVGISIQRVTARPDGFHVTLTGTDVTFDAAIVR